LSDAKQHLDNDSHSPVAPSEPVNVRHLPESHQNADESTFDASNAHSNSLEGFLLPSWQEIDLPGHDNILFSLEDAGNSDVSPGHPGYLSVDNVRELLDQGYESSEDNSEELLERLQESERLSREIEGRKAICKLTFM
jgi:hypothetical protein